MRTLGAEVILCPPVPFDDPRHFFHRARAIAAERDNAVCTEQFENVANQEAHFAATGPEVSRPRLRATFLLPSRAPWRRDGAGSRGAGDGRHSVLRAQIVEAAMATSLTGAWWDGGRVRLRPPGRPGRVLARGSDDGRHGGGWHSRGGGFASGAAVLQGPEGQLVH